MDWLTVHLESCWDWGLIFTIITGPAEQCDSRGHQCDIHQKIYIWFIFMPIFKIWRVWTVQYWKYKHAAAMLKLLPQHRLGRIRADRSHPLVFRRVPGATVSQVWWLARSKSWKTDGLHTDPLMHTDTLTHTLLTLPKGQRSIVPLRWPSTHTHTHTVSEYNSADVLPTILSIVTVRSF